MPDTQHEDLVNDARKNAKIIALIYSPIELQEYLLEIISKNSEQFIKKGNQILHFHSVDEALSHAKQYGAEEYYLCVDNTYDEFGATSLVQKYEYIPISSKYHRRIN